MIKPPNPFAGLAQGLQRAGSALALLFQAREEQKQKDHDALVARGQAAKKAAQQNLAALYKALQTEQGSPNPNPLRVSQINASIDRQLETLHATDETAFQVANRVSAPRPPQHTEIPLGTQLPGTQTTAIPPRAATPITASVGGRTIESGLSTIPSPAVTTQFTPVARGPENIGVSVAPKLPPQALAATAQGEVAAAAARGQDLRERGLAIQAGIPQQLAALSQNLGELTALGSQNPSDALQAQIDQTNASIAALRNIAAAKPEDAVMLYQQLATPPAAVAGLGAGAVAGAKLSEQQRVAQGNADIALAAQYSGELSKGLAAMRGQVATQGGTATPQQQELLDQGNAMLKSLAALQTSKPEDAAAAMNTLLHPQAGALTPLVLASALSGTAAGRSAFLASQKKAGDEAKQQASDLATKVQAAITAQSGVGKPDTDLVGRLQAGLSLLEDVAQSDPLDAAAKMQHVDTATIGSLASQATGGAAKEATAEATARKQGFVTATAQAQDVNTQFDNLNSNAAAALASDAGNQVHSPDAAKLQALQQSLNKNRNAPTAVKTAFLNKHRGELVSLTNSVADTAAAEGAKEKRQASVSDTVINVLAHAINTADPNDAAQVARAEGNADTLQGYLDNGQISPLEVPAVKAVIANARSLQAGLTAAGQITVKDIAAETPEKRTNDFAPYLKPDGAWDTAKMPQAYQTYLKNHPGEAKEVRQVQFEEAAKNAMTRKGLSEEDQKLVLMGLQADSDRLGLVQTKAQTVATKAGTALTKQQTKNAAQQNALLVQQTAKAAKDIEYTDAEIEQIKTLTDEAKYDFTTKQLSHIKTALLLGTDAALSNEEKRGLAQVLGVSYGSQAYKDALSARAASYVKSVKDTEASTAIENQLKQAGIDETQAQTNLANYNLHHKEFMDPLNDASSIQGKLAAAEQSGDTASIQMYMNILQNPQIWAQQATALQNAGINMQTLQNYMAIAQHQRSDADAMDAAKLAALQAGIQQTLVATEAGKQKVYANMAASFQTVDGFEAFMKAHPDEADQLGDEGVDLVRGNIAINQLAGAKKDANDYLNMIEGLKVPPPVSSKHSFEDAFVSKMVAAGVSENFAKGLVQSIWNNLENTKDEDELDKATSKARLALTNAEIDDTTSEIGDRKSRLELAWETYNLDVKKFGLASSEAQLAREKYNDQAQGALQGGETPEQKRLILSAYSTALNRQKEDIAAQQSANGCVNVSVGGLVMPNLALKGAAKAKCAALAKDLDDVSAAQGKAVTALRGLTALTPEPAAGTGVGTSTGGGTSGETATTTNAATIAAAIAPPPGEDMKAWVGAVDYLLANPASAGAFDHHFGEGMAKKILNYKGK